MRVLLASLLLLLAVLALPVHAQNVVYRCMDAHGSPIFSDQPCAALAATPVQPAVTGSTPTPAGAPIPLERCATSVAALRRRVIAAFAARDPNQLAGLMLWHGYGSHAAVGDIRALGALVNAPLIGVRLGDDDDDPPSAASAPADDASSLHVHTGGADGRSASFGIARQAGCLWLRFAG